MTFRIAYLFYDAPNYCAGPRINALRLLPELARRGHDVTALIGYHQACQAKAVLESQGVRVHAVQWPRFVEDQIAWLYRCLEAEQPDVFVPNISVSGCYAARYLREGGVPTIAGHLSDDAFNWGMAERFCKLGDDWAVSGLFCMGTELARIVRSWNPERTKIVEIPHGVPLPSETADPTGPIRLVFAGRLEERQKRIGETAKSIVNVLKRDPAATAKIIGDGSQRSTLEAHIKQSGVADRIELTGFVTPDRVHDAMLTGNVLILLSDFEGVPGAVMDGMACGLVPVCLDLPGGLRELVVGEETGLLVTDRGPSFQNAILRLGRDVELRLRLSANARKHIETGFSLRVAADRWERLFCELSMDAGSRRPVHFPSRPVLPPPYPGIVREDQRRPSRYARAYQRCAGLRRRVARWVSHRCSGYPEQAKKTP